MPINLNRELTEKLKSLPAAPGVYFHKNAGGEIIYVGKAAVLKNRVRQYFQDTEKDPKTAALVKEIAMTDWIVVDTEMDALFLESEMIKRYMPKWNILLRDDKSVSYVRIDLKSEIPTVTLVRQNLGDDAKYIGPFYAKNTVETALRILRKIFPYYDRPYTGKKTLNTDLGLTPGIEIGKTTPQEYKKSLKNLISYLEGNREKLLKDLEKQMKQAAKEQKYEEAAALRNQYFGLKGLKKKIVFSDKEFMDISNDRALVQLQNLLKLDRPPRRIEGYDISHQSGTNTVASMVVFVNGASDRGEYRKFKIRSSTNDDLKSMREVITRRLKHKEWDFPDLIVLDGGENQVRAVESVLAEQNLNIPVLGRNKSGDHSKGAPVVVVGKRNPENFSGTKVAEEDFTETSTDSEAIRAQSRLKSNEATLREPSFSKDYACLSLKPGSHLSRLLARIDEESHRFAITYHSLLKRKSMLK